MADEIDFDELLSQLSPDDIQTFSSAPEINSNYQILNEILEKLTDENISCENPELLIKKEIKDELYFIIPANYEKTYDKKK